MPANTLTINGNDVEVLQGESLLDACTKIGINLPTGCVYINVAKVLDKLQAVITRHGRRLKTRLVPLERGRRELSSSPLEVLPKRRPRRVMAA